MSLIQLIAALTSSATLRGGYEGLSFLDLKVTDIMISEDIDEILIVTEDGAEYKIDSCGNILYD